MKVEFFKKLFYFVLFAIHKICIRMPGVWNLLISS